MNVLTAEYIVFSMITTFIGLSLIITLKYIPDIVAYNIKGLVRKMKYSMRLRRNFLFRVIKRRYIHYRKNRHSIATQSVFIHLVAVHGYFKVMNVL